MVTGRTAEDLGSLAKEIEAKGRRVLASAGDATSEKDVSETVRKVQEQFGKVDILVNNVGVGAYKSFVETSVQEYDAMIAANNRSTFLFTRFVAAEMMKRKYGQIITISSGSGKAGYSGEAIYCGTKFAEMGLMESLDRELLQHNIKVCVVCPGGSEHSLRSRSGKGQG